MLSRVLATFLALAAALASHGCSLVVEPRVLCVDRFSLGDSLAPGLWQHFDANQGTASLSLRPGRDIAELEDEVILFRASDLEVGIEPDSGDVFARSAVQAGLDVRVSGIARDWEAGDRHWIAVRWSGSYEISPTTQGGRVSLHVDSVTPEFASDGTLDLQDETPIVLGNNYGDDTWVAVDKLIITRRPVAATSLSDPGGALERWRSASDDEQLQLPEGPWDVLFASFSDGRSGRCDGDRKAWSYPRGVLTSDPAYLPSTDGLTASAGVRPLVADERVFAGHGLYVPSGGYFELSIDARDVLSVVVTALVTTEDDGSNDSQPFLNVNTDTRNLGADYGSNYLPDRSRPELLTVSAQLPDDTTTLYVQVASEDSRLLGTFVHAFDVQYNLLENPGFEADGQPTETPSGWDYADYLPGELVVSDELREAGTYALTLRVPDSDRGSHTVSQNLDGIAEDGAVYACGASFRWAEDMRELGGEETTEPTIYVSNSDFWALHSDYDDGRKMSVGYGEDPGDGWRHLSVVGKKLRDEDRSARFSHVQFGNSILGPNQRPTHFQMDNAYISPMKVVRTIGD